MESPGYIALSRMIAQQRALDVRATNIANTNTPGFKAENVQFSDYLVPQTRRRGAAWRPDGADGAGPGDLARLHARASCRRPATRSTCRCEATASLLSIPLAASATPELAGSRCRPRARSST